MFILKNAYLVHENKTVNLLVNLNKVRILNESLDSFEQTDIIDLEGKMVLRGFSDTHMHLDKALIGDKVINQSGTLEEAIKIMTSYKPTMSDDDIYERMKKVIDMAYDNGTRYLRTNIDIDEGIKLRSLKIIHKLRDAYKHKMVIESIAFPQDSFLGNEENFKYLEQALKQGADVLGGIPAYDLDPRQHLKRLFELAKKYDVDLDVHIDETDNPNTLTIKDLISLTKTFDYQGRVTAAHCCSLASNDKEVVDQILKDAKSAELNIVPLPSTNLYLQGRGDTKNIRRGIAPIKSIVYDHKINISIGSDNIRDPFNCFGNAKPLESALISAHGAQMGATEDFNVLFDAISKNGMKIMHKDYHIENAKFFIVIDSTSPRDAIIGVAPIYGYMEDYKFILK
ncbi:MAG: amidohydrolase family protein [Acholeplasmataceae bacterium]|nr:amidohydrolase family protein [Acholeplasmataceae bacterium]